MRDRRNFNWKEKKFEKLSFLFSQFSELSVWNEVVWKMHLPLNLMIVEYFYRRETIHNPEWDFVSISIKNCIFFFLAQIHFKFFFVIEQTWIMWIDSHFHDLCVYSKKLSSKSWNCKLNFFSLLIFTLSKRRKRKVFLGNFKMYVIARKNIIFRGLYLRLSSLIISLMLCVDDGWSKKYKILKKKVWKNLKMFNFIRHIIFLNPINYKRFYFLFEFSRFFS